MSELKIGDICRVVEMSGSTVDKYEKGELVRVIRFLDNNTDMPDIAIVASCEHFNKHKYDDIVYNGFYTYELERLYGIGDKVQGFPHGTSKLCTGIITNTDCNISANVMLDNHYWIKTKPIKNLSDTTPETPAKDEQLEQLKTKLDHYVNLKHRLEKQQSELDDEFDNLKAMQHELTQDLSEFFTSVTDRLNTLFK